MRLAGIWRSGLEPLGGGIVEALNLEKSVREENRPFPHTAFVIALTGAGGKTTVMYQIAKEFAEKGYRTAVTTTTHIYAENKGIPIFVRKENPKDAIRLLEWLKEGAREEENKKSFLTTGTLGNYGEGREKLTALPAELLSQVEKWADVLLTEADGSRHQPIKIPAEWEPVLLPETALVIGCAGLSALGKTWEEACFRWERKGAFSGEDKVTAESVARILSAFTGTRKGAEGKEYRIVLNQADTPEDRKMGEEILKRTREAGQGICTCFHKERTW